MGGAGGAGGSSRATGGAGGSATSGGNVLTNNDGGNVSYAAPGFSLPSIFGSGQCTPVGIGPGGFGPTGGGGGLITWESTNCRAYYTAMLMATWGDFNAARQLLRETFPDVDKAYAATRDTPPPAPASAGVVIVQPKPQQIAATDDGHTINLCAPRPGWTADDLAQRYPKECGTK